MNPPLPVVTALNAAKIPFVVVGERALAAWIDEPRMATKTDVLVPRRYHDRAAVVLQNALRLPPADDGLGVKRLRDPKDETVRIDILAFGK